MRASIYILSFLVIAGWAVVYFKYHEGGYLHLTLAVAVIAIAIQWLPDIKLSYKLKNRTHEIRKKFKER